MSLLLSDMNAVRGIISTFIAGFILRVMPPCIKKLAIPYMWSALTEALVVSGKLCIINYCKKLKLHVPGQ